MIWFTPPRKESLHSEDSQALSSWDTFARTFGPSPKPTAEHTGLLKSRNPVIFIQKGAPFTAACIFSGTLRWCQPTGKNDRSQAQELLCRNGLYAMGIHEGIAFYPPFHAEAGGRSVWNYDWAQ